MRVVQYEIPGQGRRLGVVDGNRVCDVTSVQPEWSRTVDVFQAAEADGARFTDLLSAALKNPGVAAPTPETTRPAPGRGG